VGNGIGTPPPPSGPSAYILCRTEVQNSYVLLKYNNLQCSHTESENFVKLATIKSHDHAYSQTIVVRLIVKPQQKLLGHRTRLVV
jgi:hypothetical protein